MPIFEATRIIRERIPDRPSTIDRALRGDLETIVLTAVEKDRTKRCQSAADLAKDGRRYLNREPIEARPPTLRTRVFRWATRHPVATTSIACLFIAIGMLVSTMSATWLYNSRPYEIKSLKGGEEARLLSLSGRTLKTWRPDEPARGSVDATRLVTRPNTMGGGRLAVLGFSQAYGATPFWNSLCVYDVDGALDIPLWEKHIDDEDIPTDAKRMRGLVGKSFGVVLVEVHDIFESQHEGEEIVAIHQHESTTHSVIRVYDLQGAVLYQVWVDAFINGVHWMSGPRLLVIAGANGSHYWRDRGYPDVLHHPTVVFAIRPEAGFVSREYLGELAGGDSPTPVWYECLLPPKMSDVFDVPRLFTVGTRFDLGRFVEVSAEAVRSLGKPAGMTWILNELGEVVSGSGTPGDLYKLHQAELPEPHEIHFGLLPPVVSAPHDVEGSPRSESDGSYPGVELPSRQRAMARARSVPNENVIRARSGPFGPEVTPLGYPWRAVGTIRTTSYSPERRDVCPTGTRCLHRSYGAGPVGGRSAALDRESPGGTHHDE